mgnify:CR=1 FL=1
MKKLNYIMAAVLVAAISSCTEKIEEPTPGASRNDYVAPVEGATFSLVASASEENDGDAQSKALFDGNQLVWNSGDALNVFASSENSYEFKFAPKEGASLYEQGNTFCTTEFTPEEGETYDYTAVFPFESGLTIDSEGWLYGSLDGAPVKKTYSLYTSEQNRNNDRTHLATMPLYGTAQATGFEVPQLTMHNAVSIIEVEVANKLSSVPMEITKVKFSSNCISFGGEYYLNAKTGELELKEGTGKNEVELLCKNKEDNGSNSAMINAGDFGYYTIAVAPQTVNGTISVDVTTSQGTISATRTLKDITFNAGRIRKIKLALERNIFVKADADGTKDGSSWENAFSITQFLDYVKQNESDSNNNAIKLEGGNFYFAGGNYAVTERKIEFSGYPRRVKFNVFGGYDPASTGTDISKRDVVNNETVFDGKGTNRLFTLGNQTEPTFDGITFANLKSDKGGYESSEGCIRLAAGGSGDSRANFTNCTFRKCTGSGSQNPILLVRKGLAKLNNVIFDGCRAEGGVRALIRLAQNDSRAYLNACTFINNTYGGGGYGLLVHLNEFGGNVCLHNVTFAGNDNGCGATGVVNGTGGMLIASSTIVASNYNPAIRCESDPNSGSRLVNSLIIQERDQTAIDMSSSGRKLKSLGGNVIVGSINVNEQYEASSNDDAFANRAAASALSLSWNYDSRRYLWNGTTTFTKFTLEQLRSEIKSYSNANTGKLYAGSTEVYDGSKAGEDFLGWLDSINAFDIYGNSSAVWPGSYHGN